MKTVPLSFSLVAFLVLTAHPQSAVGKDPAHNQVVEVASTSATVAPVSPLIPSWFPKVPPLPAPSGKIIRVAAVDELFTAIDRLDSGTTILLADGHYKLPRPVVLQEKKNISIRGASGDPAKVILSGTGWDRGAKNDDLLHIAHCEGVTIADLTFSDCRSYGVKVEAENAPKDIHIYHCYFQNIGVRAIKGSAGQDPNIRAVKGSVRGCYFENTKVPPADWLFEGDYISAIDMMALEDWTFSDNVFRNIKGRNGGGRAAIFIWVRSQRVVVERNLIVDCDRGVAFGNPGQSTANLAGERLVYVADGIIRNNFIAGGADCGIELWYADGIKVFNNSIWRPERNWSRGIRLGTGTMHTQIANNLVHGEIQNEGGEAQLRQNLAGRLDNYFANPASGGLALVPTATGAIDQGAVLTEVQHDIRRRPRTARPDIGAWEFDDHQVPRSEKAGSHSLKSVELIIRDQAGELIPARVHLKDHSGKVIKAPKLPAWHDHFVCEGKVRLELPAGQYHYEIERGQEYAAARSSFTVEGDEDVQVSVTLERLAHLAAEGWWSGETHVHRDVGQAEILMRAEDLHVAQFITWWNKVNPWKDHPLPMNLPERFNGNRFYDYLAGEDERDGGALLYFNLNHPLDITSATQHYPSSLVYAKEAQQRLGTWIDIEKPFWWDLPMWLAHGIGHSIGIAQNHMNRSGVLDNEAWGKPRDRAKYPPAWGNGLWTQNIYYHLLNCGLRVPPSAGSASGVLPNPVGYNRVYVQLDGELTWNKWWDGLRDGRCFVGNGPLLRVRANGQWPGHVFQSDRPLQVQIDVRLDSRDPIYGVELVRNGRIERLTSPSSVTFQESGWFLVRAITTLTNTFRFASTAPWYVEIGKQPHPVRRDSAQFFLDWTRERITALETSPELNTAQKQQVLAPWKEAEKYWQNKVTQAGRIPVTGEVIDEASGRPIPSRLYIQHADGRWFYPESAASQGSALRYERQNWVNTNAVECHTTLSAHPFRVDLEPGRYTFTVERGKEFHPLVREVLVGDTPLSLRLPMHRWVNMAARGWFSGDTHVHRTLDELPNLMLAEDLNVAFPLTYWVTKGFAPPTQGDRSSGTDAPAELIQVDETHVFWPRNTEWEIFTVNGKSHTLGAVFALGHRSPFTLGAPPVSPIAGQARREGALLDLDKHDWPWSMALVPLMEVDLFELANNHHWRTEFGITQWSSPAPAYMGLPSTGSGGDERSWTLYGFQNYYALLNCGFRLRPTAGTANGVHPVPLGFGRVYVHLPVGFSYEAWRQGLNQGRSFVTTGPMLLAEFTPTETSGMVLSEEPVNELEVILNGQAHLLPLEPVKNAEGAWEARFRYPLKLEGTSWVAARCFEPRPGGRFRFAHTAPRWFEDPGRPLQPRQEEVAFLIQRTKDEMERSRNVLPPAALAEYQKALDTYERITGSAGSAANSRRPRDKDDLRYWLENMLVYHRFTPAEASLATGLTPDEIAGAASQFGLPGKAPSRSPGAPLRILPYPGGRHPRIGFLEGAIHPQRETKFSAFTPWDEASYVLVDVPEAIWSNLGLTYLAHTHIDTLWSKQGIELEPLEWNRRPDGSLDIKRVLPNNISFGAKIVPSAEAVRMELWLRNGTKDTLQDLRVQNCIMLKNASGFNAQTLTNKVFAKPYAAVRSEDARRWIITAWHPADRCWGNDQVPCLHADPKFPDCPPGQTVHLRGWLSFYEGEDITAEFNRIDQIGWWN